MPFLTTIAKYKLCKQLFTQISETQYADITCEYNINEDTCALRLKFTSDTVDKPLEFYYVYGNSQIVSSYDSDIHVITATNADAALIQINNSIEEWIKHKKLL